MNKDLAILNQKLDYLTEQLESQHRRQEELSELVHDTVPVVNHMVKLSINELAEVGTDFQLEDLTFLLKRVLRDTRLLVSLLDQVEAFAELAEEGQKMGKRIFHQITMELDRLEREGYFELATASAKVLDRLVHEVDGSDVTKLGDNLIDAMHADVPEKVSLFALLRQMGNPKVRRGLFRSLNLLKVMGG